ncbi:MAG: hypothetical protein FRX49_12880, partial [Trebouxia sp. A1-2]
MAGVSHEVMPPVKVRELTLTEAEVVLRHRVCILGSSSDLRVGRGMLFIRVGVERTSSSRVSPFADWKMGINAGAKMVLDTADVPENASVAAVRAIQPIRQMAFLSGNNDPDKPQKAAPNLPQHGAKDHFLQEKYIEQNIMKVKYKLAAVMANETCKADQDVNIVGGTPTKRLDSRHVHYPESLCKTVATIRVVKGSFSRIAVAKLSQHSKAKACELPRTTSSDADGLRADAPVYQ